MGSTDRIYAGFDIPPRLKSGDSYCAHPGIEPE